MSQLILLLAVLCADPSTPAPAPPPPPVSEAPATPPVPTLEERVAAGETLNGPEQMHLFAMRHRVRNGLRAQRIDADCMRMAQAHANWMAANHNMSHSNNDQVIAAGQGSPEGAISAWINSSGHNFWLLSNTSRAGWGYAISSNGTPYYCGVFRSDGSEVEQAVSGGVSSGWGRRRLFRWRR